MNESSKHTPGPWKAVGQGFNWLVKPVNEPVQDEAIALRILSESNARLIASAPELLKALKIAEDYLEMAHADKTHDGCEGLVYSKCDLACVWRIVHKVIAHAEGK